MNQNRLETVLRRTRKNLVLDVALVVLFAGGTIVSGIAMRDELGELGQRPAAARSTAAARANSTAAAPPCPPASRARAPRL